MEAVRLRMNLSSDRKDGAGEDLVDQAIDWRVRLGSGESPAQDAVAYREWTTKSPAHRAAAAEAERLWGAFDAVPRPQDVPRIAPVSSPAARRRPAVSRRSLVGGALAAGLAVAALGGSGALGPLSGLYADYATGVGERREVALPDGSALQLDAASSVSLDFTAGRRIVRLHEGRAVFDVRSDPARPFEVLAAEGRTTAVGTVFQVAREAQGASVTVLEGRVEVRPPASGGQAAARLLEVGERASYGEDGRLDVHRVDDPTVATAWRRGKLIVDGERLGDVVDIAARYRRAPIVIVDEAAANLKVTGVFELADTDGLLSAIDQTLPVRVHRLPFMTLIR
jgi:transmembrane sensor